MDQHISSKPRQRPSSERPATLDPGDETPISLAWPPGRMVLTQSGTGAPLLLVHSLNAAASSYEVAAIRDHAKNYRRVFSLDLPGFGRSSRGRADYTIGFYVAALLQAAEEVRSRSGAAAIDALGLSLSCEFLGRAASERPDVFRSLVVVNPTGFEAGSSRRRGAPETRLASRLLERALTIWLWRRPLFKILVSKPSIRFFLRRTFGGQPPADMVDYAYWSAHQPKAEFAPLAFASGKLFAADIRDVYERLDLPVWLTHGTKGSFNDFSEADWVKTRSNWAVTPFETGAFPHLQAYAQFMPLLARFLEDAPHRAGAWSGALDLAPAVDAGQCL